MLLRKSHRIILLTGICLLFILGSVYAASRVIIPSVIRKNGSSLLGVPVRVREGGINFLNTTFWLKDLEVQNVHGSKERIFLSFKYFEFDLSFTSILANELIIEDIRFEEPVLNLERDTKGNLNSDWLARQFKNRFHPRIHISIADLFRHYAIQHFSVKNGTFRHFNQSAPEDEKEWLFREIDFSFSEFDYPSQHDNPTNTSLHLSAKLNEDEEGKIRILGSGNFISSDKNFRLKSSFKNIALQDVNSLLSSSAQEVTAGFVDVESELNCEHNQLKVKNHVLLRKIKFPEIGNGKTDEIIFGFSRETLSQFFNLMQDRPFRFDFDVSGNLNDASFNLKESFIQSFFHSAYESLNESIDRLNKDSLQRIEKIITKPKNGSENNPMERFRQILEKFVQSQSSNKSSNVVTSINFQESAKKNAA